ncbi:MAG: TonB-dependent receptor plug domain-containing protein [Saprospiraceae bacterium]|nr:TonB-dependent receptor plug domain-containing protein [Saprospiraceae bacterium]
MRHLFCCCWIGLALLPLVPLNAQSDTLLLPLNRLLTSDLITPADTGLVGKVLSGTRNLQDPEDLPIGMYVVTKEEIRRNNCITLADVLKNLPGFRVSQPGSADLGETFLMRGVLGNAYTRILINDVPLRTGNLRGLPLGAQLPVRQAERIEIIYGPAADMYDPAAAAGVINIILQQTERPAYAEADLFVGVSGYTDINVSFGGKIGTSKRGLRYRLYGSHTRTNRQTIDNDLPFNPANYQVDTLLLLQNPNYLPVNSLTLFPYIGEFPFESRQLGLDLQWRGWQFAASTHYRRDHSALGRHPAAVSYADNGTFTGESFSQAAASYTKTFRGGLSMRIMASTVNYEQDPQGSIAFVESALHQDLRTATRVYANGDDVLADSLNRYIFNRYFSGRRYSDVTAFSFRLEPILFYQPFPWLQLTAGWVGQILEGDTEYFLTRPYAVNQSKLEDTKYYYFYSQGEQSLFSQVFAHWPRLSLLAGLRRYNPEFGEPRNLLRFATQYKPARSLRLRVGYGEAALPPYSSYNADTYIVQNYGSLQNPFAYLENLSVFLEPELFNNWEAALSWRSRQNWEIELNWHRQAASQLIAPLPLQLDDPASPILPIRVYANQAGELHWEAWGLNLTRRNIGTSKESFFSLQIQRGKGREILANSLELPFVREMPRWLVQANVFARIARGIYLQINQQYLSGMYHRSVTNPGETGVQTAQNYQFPFYNLDLTGHFRITDQVQFIFKMKNVTSANYAGLSGGSRDDLLYNPQRGRTTFIGLSYRMK